MSKELEVMDRIKGFVNQHYIKSCYGKITKDDAMLLEAQIYDNIDLLKQSLTPPTSEEIVKELSEYYKEDVIFKDNKFYWGTVIDTKYVVASINDNGTINITNKLLPYIIELLGKFYKGEMKDE